MASFDEEIVREYFELHGFLVRQMRKYVVQSRKKVPAEEIDLLVYNPAFRPGQRDPEFLLFATELPYVHRALVAVKPWHTTRFTPGTLKSSSQLFSFLEKNVLKEAETLFALDAYQPDVAEKNRGEPAIPLEHVHKILVLPGLPTGEPHRAESIRLLRERGVDGIISFRSMLLDLMNKVEINRNYQKSGLLQILRVLKNYDLLRPPQQELFSNK